MEVTPYYTDESVTLYHGDCREVPEWLTADVLVTDPPYGIAWPSGSMHTAGKQMRVANSVQGDENLDARDAVLTAWGTKPALVFGSWRQPRPRGTAHRLIWYKRQADPGFRTAAFYPAEEEVYVLGAGWVGKPIQNVLVTNERRTGATGLVATVGHPTPKPVSLMERLIVKCPPGVIADPFAGSGSTLVAAKQLGRKAIGVELDERYCEIAARRLSQGVLDFGEPA